MESIKAWLQDWSEACEYAKECAPDLSFFIPHEPYTAFAGIAAACFLIWWWNEKHIAGLLDYEGKFRLLQDFEHAPTASLREALDQMGSVRATPQERAA